MTRQLKYSNSISLSNYLKEILKILNDKKNWVTTNNANNWVEYGILKEILYPKITSTDAARQRESELNRNARFKRIGTIGHQESISEKITKGKDRILQRCLNSDKRIIKNENKWYIRLNDKPIAPEPKFNLLKNMMTYFEEHKSVQLDELYSVFVPKINRIKCKKVDIKDIKKQKIDACIRKLRNRGCIKAENKTNLLHFIKHVSFTTDIKEKKKKNR